jgi:hypothetical protein
VRGVVGMASPTLIELADNAMAAEEPACTSPYIPKNGGVDPLGLRQINFDLMDMVLPGLNNIASHIRPFTVVAWAWRRAAVRAQELGKISVNLSDLEDFVDRIEVIYAWSQFLRNPNAELPGRDVLASLVNGPDYVFGGEFWRRRREIRENSTALSAPINYGPTLKALGWLEADPAHTGAMRATPLVLPALAALEEQIADLLSHPAFSNFGEVRVTTAEAKQWAASWALDQPTSAERKAMAESLIGETAQARRRQGVKLIASVVDHLGQGVDVRSVRRTMCGAPTGFVPGAVVQQAAEAWRTLQVRQAFRLSLEALLYWALQQLDHGPMMTPALVEAFLNASGDVPTTREWLVDSQMDSAGPADWLERLENSLTSPVDPNDLPRTIRSTLAASLREAPANPGTQREDRLPLARAAQQARAWSDLPPTAFMAHVFDSWIFGQHVYWSVGRGLADARSHGKTILRLKVVLEEDGWTMAPGATANAPRATPDRLETALSLMREADLIA